MTAQPGTLAWRRPLWRSVLQAMLLVLLAQAGHAAQPQPGLQLYRADGQSVGLAPQLHTDVSIRVTGMLARVRVQQRFRNRGDAWVEGVYVFPLPQNAAVDRLRMLYAERLIEGEIQEKRQARATYERARTSGQGATLLDQQRANIFTAAVANIPPGETVQVEIEYQQELRWRDGGFSLRFPTVVGPRYIPGTPQDGRSSGFAALGWAVATDQVPDAAQITPPVVAAADGNLNPVTITVDLNAGLVLDDISSPYHAIVAEEQSVGRYRVTLAPGVVPAERDFVLRWRPLPTRQPAAALFSEVWRDAHYKLLLVMPPYADAVAPDTPRELILVIDTSGSMHGGSIEQARAAVLGALQQLRAGDRFNVIQFNDVVHALFDRARPADAENLGRARRYVQALRAEGGTEMLPAMRRALREPRPSGLLRQVVFLTDGAVGNEQALFEAVVRDIGDSRLFTVGIGSAPNALFMTRAATFGRGTFTYIGSTDEVDDKVSGLFRRLNAPVLTDVRLRWQFAEPGAALEQTPQRIPDLYAGEPLVVALKTDRAAAGVQIDGRLGEQPWRHTLALRGGAAGGGVHALWARRRIADWLARLASGAQRDEVRHEVLALALQHHLVSRYSSLVAVDRTPARAPSTRLESAALPTRLPAGWSAAAVFGRLPGTATAAPLLLVAGAACLLLAWATGRRA